MTRLLPTGRRLVAVDVIVTAWVVAWLVIGVRVSQEFNGLANLGRTLSTFGSAAEVSARELRALDVPIIGGRVGRIAGRIERIGASARASGERSRESVDELGTLLGLSIALIPTIPVLFMYVPARVARSTEVSTLRQAVHRLGDDPALERFLARRALDNLSYRRLSEVSHQPWRDFEEGRCRELAAAELARLGLSGRR